MSKQWQGRAERVLGGPRSSSWLLLIHSPGPIDMAEHHAVRLPRFRTVYPTNVSTAPYLLPLFHSIHGLTIQTQLAWNGWTVEILMKGVLTRLIIG